MPKGMGYGSTGRSKTNKKTTKARKASKPIYKENGSRTINGVKRHLRKSNMKQLVALYA